MAWFRQDSIWSLLESHMSFKKVIQGWRKTHFIMVSCSEKRICCCELNDWQLWWDMNRRYFLSGSTQRQFSVDAAGSSIQMLSKSWQNAFHSDICDAKGIKSCPIRCLCLAGRMFCIGTGNVWRFLAVVFVITSACPVGSCYVKTGTQNTGKTAIFRSINNLMEMKCQIQIIKHQSVDDERKSDWKCLNILKFTQASTLGSFQLKICHIWS